MKKCFTLHGNNDKGIYLKNGNQQLAFDIPIYTNEGVLWCIYMKRVELRTNGRTIQPVTRFTADRHGQLINETNAIDIEDQVLDGTYYLGKGELSHLITESIAVCP